MLTRHILQKNNCNLFYSRIQSWWHHNFFLIQVPILLYPVRSDSKIWDLRWWSLVNQTKPSFPHKHIIRRRFINRLANISLDSSLRENRSKTRANISSSALEYFQKVPLLKISKQLLHCQILQLSVADVESLYELYEKDFLMFGYSPESYKDAAASWFLLFCFGWRLKAAVKFLMSFRQK